MAYTQGRIQALAALTMAWGMAAMLRLVDAL
jgi:hypothetical protein